MKHCILPVLVLSQLAPALGNTNEVKHPTVALNHGGRVKGTAFNFEGSDIAVFYGIPYAKPPVGELRFEKTQPADPWIEDWDGSRNHLIHCPQVGTFGTTLGKYVGQEDCLVLDVYVPSGVVPPSEKKAVMVWIHGGGYLSGAGSEFPMFAFSQDGDVIVVSLNYRLGPLGFLNQIGLGNFGLWDIRQALIWIQDHIGNFGGDSNQVTIFGHSAGGSAVSALTVSQHTDGLFHRAISQSGAVYSTWSWGQSDRQRREADKNIGAMFNCSEETELYECLRHLSTEEVILKISSVTIDGGGLYHPFYDGDFFGSTSEQQNYDLTRRFDIMSGTANQDGLITLGFAAPFILSAENSTLNDGFTSDQARRFLNGPCQGITPTSPELCVYYFHDQYGLSDGNNMERTFSLINFMTDLYYAAGSRRTLLTHSGGDKSTYGYRFESLHSVESPFPVPDWLKIGADHAEEIPILLNGHKLSRNFFLINEVAYDGRWDGNETTTKFILSQKPDYVMLSATMTRYWTNFAKSGNPNVPLEDGINSAQWHQFDAQREQVMMLDKNSTVGKTQRKETLELFDKVIMTAQKRRLEAERLLGTPDQKEQDMTESFAHRILMDIHLPTLITSIAYMLL